MKSITRIRVGVIILDKNKILTVKMNRENSKDIYVLPGGGVKNKEDIFDAAVRETKEETNLNIKIIKILYLKSLYSYEDNALEIILLGKIKKGELRKGFDPEEKGRNIIKEVKFIEVSKLKKINFHPKQLKGLIEKDIKEEFKNHTIYLGNFQYPE
jgi:ADP-ribose pyrophosphatase YjhB (NUDIX family)